MTETLIPRCYSLSSEAVRAVAHAARAREVSASAIVREALREWMARHRL